MKRLFYLILIPLLLIINHVYAQELVNGSFEIKSPKNISRGWTLQSKSPAYHIKLDSGNVHTGKYALKLESAETVKRSEAIVYNGYGLTSANKITTIEVSAWFKTTNAPDSALGIFIQSLSGRQIIPAFVNTSSNLLSKWQKVTLKYEVNAKQPWAGFYYGITLNKPASAWVDDVTVTVDGKQIKDPQSFYFEPSATHINWLNNQLKPLNSFAIQASHADMVPIGKLCGNARLVGIGEPTHGTHEALQFKLRLLEYLVTQKGFNTIALEEEIPTCDIMNDVLNAKPAAIKDSLMQLPFYKLWKSAEMNDLFVWISRYNATHTKKVKFIGVDMEDIRIRTSRRMIREVVQQQDKAITAQLNVIDQRLDTLIAANSTNTKPAIVQSLADSLKAELAALAVKVNKLEGIITAEQLFRLQSYVRVCQQWLDTRFYDKSTYARDNYMASNMKFYIDHHPGTKVLIWAHNAHISNLTSNSAKMMGAWLKDYYGKNYVPIAFTSASGSYTATEDYTQKVWKAYGLETAYRGTYSYILAKAKSDLYFLPLNTTATKQPEAFWLHMPMRQLEIKFIQSGSDEDYNDYGTLSKVFDGVVFCKSTTASQSYLKR